MIIAVRGEVSTARDLDFEFNNNFKTRSEDTRKRSILFCLGVLFGALYMLCLATGSDKVAKEN